MPDLYFSENIPRLNIAMPRPASDKIDMDRATIAGITTFHLHTTQHGISTLCIKPLNCV